MVGLQVALDGSFSLTAVSVSAAVKLPARVEYIFLQDARSVFGG